MNIDLQSSKLPTPQPEKDVRRKLFILAALALIALSAAAFWLTRDATSKKELTQSGETLLQNAGLAPLVDATKKLLDPPPPPPTHSLGLAAPGIAANGTLIQGSLASPAELDKQLPASSPDSAPASTPDSALTGAEKSPVLMPPQRDDTVIKPEFLHDLAAWFVARYKPLAGGKGQTGISPQSANLRYGSSLRGMERQTKDLAGSRAAILRYVFNPAMLEALYALYADRLVHELAQAALAPVQGKALGEDQLDGLYRAYAAFFSELSSVCGGIAALPDLKKRTAALDASAQQTIAIHQQLVEKVFARDAELENGQQATAERLQEQIDALNTRYRTSIQDQAAARSALVSAIRKGKSSSLDDDNVLFMALWVERRMAQQADALEATRTASALLDDLARRFTAAASGNKTAGAAGTL